MADLAPVMTTLKDQDALSDKVKDANLSPREPLSPNANFT